MREERGRERVFITEGRREHRLVGAVFPTAHSNAF